MKPITSNAIIGQGRLKNSQLLDGFNFRHLQFDFQNYLFDQVKEKHPLAKLNGYFQQAIAGLLRLSFSYRGKILELHGLCLVCNCSKLVLIYQTAHRPVGTSKTRLYHTVLKDIHQLEHSDMDSLLLASNS